MIFTYSLTGPIMKVEKLQLEFKRHKLTKQIIQGWPKELVMGCENFSNLCVAIGGTIREVGRFLSSSLSPPTNLPKNG